MNDAIHPYSSYEFASELLRLLRFATRGPAPARNRPAMELIAMHVLPDRFVAARHYVTYAALSRQARRQTLEHNTHNLMGDLIAAQARVTAVFGRERICPQTRQGALLRCVLERPVLTRAHLAEAVNVSVVTAGRWLLKLSGLGVVRRLAIGNVEVYVLRDIVFAVLRENQRLSGLPTDDATVGTILNAPIKVEMIRKMGRWYEPRVYRSHHRQ